MEQLCGSIWPVFGTINAKTADVLLSRDWFVEEDDIHELLQDIDDDGWDVIYANRSKYSQRIRMIIEPDDYKVDLKMKLNEMTDRHIDKIESDREDVINKKFDAVWEDYKKTITIERPYDSLDDELDEAWDRLNESKSKMTQYLASRRTAYVPPGQRGKIVVDPRQEEIEEEIEELENEFNRLQSVVDTADSVYLDKKKNEHKISWMLKLQT